MDNNYKTNHTFKYLSYTPTVMEQWEYKLFHTKKDVISDFESGLQILKDKSFRAGCLHRTLIAGGMAAFDKGIIDFLHKWNDMREPIFLLSEVAGEFKRYTADTVQFPYFCTPHLLSKEMVVRGMDLDKSEGAESLFSKSKYIREAVVNMNGRYGTLGKNYAVIWAYYAYNYINLLLDKLEPCRVILWNEFYAFHIIFKNLCIEKGIDVCFMEFGNIPGTFSVDNDGQQGESRIALRQRWGYNRAFDTGKIIYWIRQNRLNRNRQPTIQFGRADILGYREDKPVILYLGQDDYESCLYPYTWRTKRFHSPYFKSSDSAARMIERICRSNSWNFVYKLHPIMAQLGNTYELHRQTNGVVVNDVDLYSVIENADIVLTILSQGAYHALIHEKPVIMLGYNQLRNKGCIYQLKGGSWRKLEHLMKKALRKGFTDKQRKRFENHVAYLLGKYLYDDGLHDEMPYGKRLV